MNSLSDLESVKYSANAEIDKTGTAISNNLSKITGGDSLVAPQTGNGDVIGIDGKEVPNLKMVIKNYVDTVNEKFEKINTSAATIGAFSGKYAIATSNFTQSIANACSALTGQLLYFNDELDKVKAAFDAKSAEMAIIIDAVSGDIVKATTNEDQTVQQSTTSTAVGVSSIAAASIISSNTNPTSQTITEQPVVTPAENKAGSTSVVSPSLFSGFSAYADNGTSNTGSSNTHSNFKQQIVNNQINNKIPENKSKDIVPEKETVKTEVEDTPVVKAEVQAEKIENPVVTATAQSEAVETPTASVGKKMDIPTGDTWPKQMESYHRLTKPNTAQYQITHGGTWNGKKYVTRTDPKTSVRITNVDGQDYYLAAMGTYYGQAGDKFKIKTDTGKEFNVLLGDVKGTDSGTYHKDATGESGTYYHNFNSNSICVVEMIYDPSALPDAMRVAGGTTGTFSTLPEFSGNVVSIEKLK